MNTLFLSPRALKKAAHKKKNKISSSFEGSDCEEDKDSGKVRNFG